LSVFAFNAQLYAAPAKCSLVKVAKKGMRLGDVVASNDIKELLIIQRLNSIQNPYDMKEGLLIIVPEKSFMDKAGQMSFKEMNSEVDSYKSRIPQAILKQAAESAAGVKEFEENKASDQNSAYHKNVKSSSMSGVKGSKPEEIERIAFPRRLKH
jgi:hypothetical protein